MNNQFQQQLQYSPTTSHSICSSPVDKHRHRHKSSTSSIHSPTKDISTNDHLKISDGYSSSMPNSQRPRSPSMISNNFIRVHFPNKHTTAVSFDKEKICNSFVLINNTFIN